MICFKITKFLLFTLNFLFWLVGAALLGVGIWLLVDPTLTDFIEIAGVDFYVGGAVILIVVGSFLFVFGFFGCCGAIRESPCLLGTYFILLVIVFGLQVGLGIWALISYDSLEETITKNIAQLNLTNGDIQEVMSAVQSNLKCCGTTKGCEDWQNDASPLESCACIDQNSFNTSKCEKPPLRCSAASSEYIYTQPCDEAVYNILKDNAVIIGACVLGIALLEIIQMIAAIGLCCAITGKD